MTEWRDLYLAHRGMRSTSADLGPTLRLRLVRLAERGHCARTVQGRFTWRQRGALREWFIDSVDEREPLLELPSLPEAHLTLLALVSRRDDRLHQFTAMHDRRDDGDRVALGSGGAPRRRSRDAGAGP
jgi:hypothetical protein